MNDVQLVPFVQVEGDWILSDWFLTNVYHQVRDQKLIKTVFWEGNIETLDEFISFTKKPTNIISFVFYDRICIGMTWLSPVSGNHGFGHFCFLKQAWGKHTIRAGRMTMDYWMNFPGVGGPLLDVVIGVMPMFNTRAHAYIEKIGGVRLGVIPSMFRDKQFNRDDAVIYYFVRS